MKSGTLAQQGVNNLAGYIHHEKNKDVYSFVILTQTKRKKEPAYKGTYSKPVLQSILDGLKG